MPGKEVNVPECPSVAVGASRGCAAVSAFPRAVRSCCHAPDWPTDPVHDPSGAIVSTTSGIDKQLLAALLAESEPGGALDTVAQPEMPADADRLSQHESETLEAESRDARGHDQQLATDLRRGTFEGPTSAAGQLQQLGDRPRLPVATERRLVQAAKDGDQRAREELVEAFLPMIAGVARVYRGSPLITRVELMQEGVVGLLRALERYDPTLGVPFLGVCDLVGAPGDAAVDRRTHPADGALRSRASAPCAAQTRARRLSTTARARADR